MDTHASAKALTTQSGPGTTTTEAQVQGSSTSKELVHKDITPPEEQVESTTFKIPFIPFFIVMLVFCAVAAGLKIFLLNKASVNIKKNKKTDLIAINQTPATALLARAVRPVQKRR